MLRALSVLVVISISSAAFGQVLYLPVQSQFRTGRGDATYYYGGTDARVHAAARYTCQPYGYSNNLHRFDGGNSFGQPSPLYDRTQVFTDCIPFQDAAHFGYTAADAENEARANAATYFRKADLLAGAIPMLDGSLVVPPTPTPVYVAPVNVHGASTVPAHGQIIIIPKRLLDRPLKEFTAPTPGKVASAQ
jgi:hypothetical protein